MQKNAYLDQQNQTTSATSGPEVIKVLLIKAKILTKKFPALSLSDVFILLINVKMPTIVGILTFTSRINFVLS